MTGRDITIVDVPHDRRFEARIGEDTAGVATYIRTPEMIVFVHTEVSDTYAGRGVGSALARGALDQARAQNLRVLAICPFVQSWLAKHPEYQDLEYEPTSQVTD
jgi:predicted GNAT family acetyltransferase